MARCTRFAATQWVLLTALSMLCFSAGCGSDEDAPETNIGSSEGTEATSDPTSATEASSDTDAVESSGSQSLPAAAAENMHPTVQIKTSAGTITVRCDREKARLTVENFLEQYVDRKHYDGTIFHHVEKDFMIVGGGYTPEMELKPTRAEVFNEATNGLSNRRGTIAMARVLDDVHSATCQFFFNLTDNTSLDHQSRETPEQYGYCVFGEVTQGMDVLDKIAKVNVAERDGLTMVPVQPVVIESIRRVE